MNRSAALRGLIFLVFAIAIAPLPAFAQAPAAAGTAQRTTLSNGLELLVLEQPEAERVRMGIIFKAGASTQSEKTAGLFRMLELVLFRGRATGPGEAEPAGALDALGAANLSGGAGTDRFDFWFDVAPDRAAAGLDTLANLFSGYLFDAALSDSATVEQARTAALEWSRENSTDPGAVYEAALARKMFSKAPWRFDPAGADYVLRSAGADSLRAVASAWLVPNNALLVVTGKVSAEEIRIGAETALGAWKKSADPWKTPFAALPKPGITRPTLMAYPDPRIPEGEVAVEMRYRGPDVASQSATGAAILFAEMASSPKGRLALAVSKGMPKASQTSGPEVLFASSGFASYLSLGFAMKLEQAANIADRVLSLKEIVRGAEMYSMKTNAGYFAAAEYGEAKIAFGEKRMATLSDPAGAAALLADSWIAGGAGWFARLPEIVEKTGSKDMTAFADEYFMKNLEIVALRINPADYASRKKSLDSYGFEQISASKAFWWM